MKTILQSMSKARKSALLAMLLMLAMFRISAQTSICPTHVQNNSSSHVTFNLQNTNAFPIVVTTVSAYIGSGSQSIQVLYNPTPINSSGATWTQGIVGAGQNGWVSAYSGTQTIATAGVNTISSTLTIIIPANSTYGFAISSTSLSYMSLTAGAGVNTFGTSGVFIKTGDNISWGGAVFPATPVNYPRGFHGCIGWIPYGPCTNPPTAGTATTTASTVCLAQTVNLGLTGGSGGAGQTYQWKVSSVSGGPYTNVGTASTSSTYTATPSVGNNYYVCEVNCGGGTSTSTEVVVNVPTPFPGGNYTINNALPTGGTNFNSFTAAVSAISCGIAGPVTFDVAPTSGPYNEQISLPATIGATATNTVTFNGNGRTISYTSTNANQRYVIKLDGADYITFNELTIDGSGASLTTNYAFTVQLINNADYNTFSLCNIKASTTTTSTNHTAVVISGSATSATTSGASGNYNTFIDNTISGGYYGITMIGGGTGTENLGNNFTNNIIKDCYSYCMYMLYQRQAIIFNNDISRPTRTTTTTAAGIFQTTGCYGNDVENNKIHNMFDGIPTSTSAFYGLYLVTSGTVAEPNKIINNVIYDIKGSGSIYGFYNSAAGNTKFYHNTMSYDYAASTAGLVYGVYQTGTASNVDIRNNIIAISKGGTAAKVGLYYASTASTISSNNNVIYLNATGTGVQSFGYWGSVAYATKATFNTASGLDANSVQTNPVFTAPSSPTYNFTPTSILTNNIGANVGVPYDILGNPRLAVTPDPGAYEYALAGLDAGISWVSPTSPTTPGLKTITVNLVNNLSTPISSVTLAYNTPSGTPVTQTFTGLSFLPSTSQNFSFSTQFNLIASASIRAYIVNVNGVVDNAQGNDTTAYQSLCLQLNGTYTLNSAVVTGGSNFQSFNDLASALSCGGISGPVVVNVVSGSGPYNEQVSFGVIPGSSVVNTVTINGNNNVLTSAGSSSYHTLRLNGADFMSWNNLVVNATDPTYAIALNMSNGSDNNNFVNCTFAVNQANISSTSSAVAFSASTTSATTAGNNGNNNIFSGCTMSGGYYCVSLYGNSTTSTNTNNQFYNCTITEFYYYGIYVLYQTAPVIKNCIIERPTRATVSAGYCVYLSSTVTGGLFEGNRIRKIYGGAPGSTNTGAGFYCFVAGTLGNENRFINNVVADITHAGGFYGMYMSGANYTQVYHNTIAIDGLASTGTGTIYGIYNSGTTGADYRNNIITVRRGGTGSKYCLYYGSTPAISNYNDLVMNSAGTTNYVSYISSTAASYATLAAYQSSLPTLDQQSIAVNPYYNNPALNDYKPTEVLMNDVGFNVGIATDITGAVRPTPPATNPDMGAYEFSVAPTDLGMFSFDGPGTSGCYSATQDVTVSIKNYGTAPINFSTNPATVSCDVSGPVTTTLTTTVSTGTLAVGATLSVTLPAFNMTANGSYVFSNISLSMPGDGLVSNNVLPSNYTRVVGVVSGTISTPSASVCISSPSPTITLTGNYGGNIQWQQSTVSASGPWTNVGTGGQTFVPAPMTANTYYFQAVLTCNTNTVTTNVITIGVNSPTLTGTTPGSRCGAGTVVLGATASGTSDVKWYTAPTGGTALYTGTSFTTPVISSTTNFYAEPVSGAGLLTGLGATAVPTTSGYNAQRGIQFDAYQTFTLVSFDFYAAYAGTTTMTVLLQNSAGTTLQTFSLTDVSTNAAAGWHTVPLNMIVQPGTGYKLLCTFNTGSLSNYSHSTGANYASTAFNNLGSVGLITNGLDNGPIVSTTSYWYFYNLVVSAGCNGLRVPVTATVNTSPAVMVAATSSTICDGENTTLSVSSPNDPNYTYTWAPGGLTGNTVTVTPSTSTVYTLTAQDNTTGTYAGCGNLATQSITVNPSPTPVSVTPATTTVCQGTNVSLMASGGVPPPTGYCTPSYTTGTSSGDYCTLVSIGGTTLNNPSGASATPYYTLYPASGSTTATLSAGTTYTISISAGTWTLTGNNFAAFIDYNQNGTFEPTEKLGQLNDLGASPAVGTMVFSIPSGAYNGATRFRVREVYSNTAIDACTSASFGETEDYVITINGGVNQGNFTWTPGATLSSTTANPATVSGLIGTETYTATFTNGYGCTKSASAAVTVKPTSTSTTTYNLCGPSYTWNGTTYTAAGTYTYVTTNSVGCDSTATLILTANPCNTTLNLTCFIQGYWDGVSGMAPALFNQGETTTATACDSIDVELHSDTAPYGVDANVRAVLNQNGTATCVFPAMTGAKYIVVKHRNALQTWSADPVLMSTSVNYNFSDMDTKAYGNNMIQVSTSPSVWAFFSGDVVVDENMDLLDLGAVETDISNFGYGYLSTDLNGDGNVDLLDSPMLESNISAFIYSNHP